MMYGVYVKYVNGYRERIGFTHINKKGSMHTKTYASWDNKEAAQRCADILMSHSDVNHIVKAEVKECKK